MEADTLKAHIWGTTRLVGTQVPAYNGSTCDKKVSTAVALPVKLWWLQLALTCRAEYLPDIQLHKANQLLGDRLLQLQSNTAVELGRHSCAVVTDRGCHRLLERLECFLLLEVDSLHTWAHLLSVFEPVVHLIDHDDTASLAVLGTVGSQDANCSNKQTR